MQTQTATPSQPRASNPAPSTRADRYRPPQAGAGFNERLAADVQKRFPGDMRFQVAMFCKHCSVPADQAGRLQDEQRARFEMGGVVNDSVNALVRCGVRVQNLGELSQKNLLTAVRFWRQKGHAHGTIRWRVAVLRSFTRLLGRHMPMLREGSGEL